MVIRVERENLFRGKRADNGKWIEGVPYGEYMICGMNLLRADAEIPMSEYPEFDYVRIIPETVGQYTGLTDENGVKIFEGDIVKAHFPNKYEFVKDEFIEKIKFRNGCFWFGSWNFIEFLDKFRNYKVVGNIHDNPELLKSKG